MVVRHFTTARSTNGAVLHQVVFLGDHGKGAVDVVLGKLRFVPMAAPVHRSSCGWLECLLRADCVEKVGWHLPALDRAGNCSNINSASLETPPLDPMRRTMF